MNYRIVLDDICELSISIDCTADEIIDALVGLLLTEEEAGNIKKLMENNQ